MSPSSSIKALTALLFALALSACGTQQVQVVHDTKVIAPQDSLLQDCPVEPPPAKDEYAAMDKDEKIKALSSAYNKQTVNVGLCNKDKAGLRTWKAKEVAQQEEKK